MGTRPLLACVSIVDTSRANRKTNGRTYARTPARRTVVNVRTSRRRSTKQVVAVPTAAAALAALSPTKLLTVERRSFEVADRKCFLPQQGDVCTPPGGDVINSSIRKMSVVVSLKERTEFRQRGCSP